MLDELVDVIETVQRRIRDYGASLRENETRTRTALIDPLLTVLGWDVSDPSVVTPEYRVNIGWADYALAGPGNQPAAVIEAKRLGSTVENHLDQAIGYCIQQGIAYAGVTDGEHWQLYRTFEPVPMADKLVLDLHIGNSQAHAGALQLLMLWRPNLASGQPLAAADPILGLETPANAVLRQAQDEREGAESAAAPEGGEWVSLSEFAAPPGIAPPASIAFPNSQPRAVEYWYEILTHSAEYLVQIGSLTPDKVPIRSSPVRYVVNTQPVHPNGNSFGKYRSIPDSPFFVNTNLNALQVRTNTKNLLEHCGVDPATVHVQTGD